MKHMDKAHDAQILDTIFSILLKNMCEKDSNSVFYFDFF